MDVRAGGGEGAPSPRKGLRTALLAMSVALGVVGLVPPLVQPSVVGGTLQRLGLGLKYTHFAGPLALLVCAMLAGRLGAGRRNLLLLGGVLASCWLMLYATWVSGLSDGFVIGGLLPYSDASGYYEDALRLLHGQSFTAFSSRRPLGPVLLGALLAGTGLDLRMALGLLTLMTAVALWLAAREMWETTGAWTGALMLLSLVLFYRRYIGTTLTEHLGLTLGCVAFALVWRGAASARVGPVLVGLAALSLGLNARAGALLILPALVVWLVMVFGRPGCRARLAIAAVGAGLAGFLANGMLLRLVGIPGAAFSNFAYVLYGLVRGGGWTLALQQHPELHVLPPLEQSQAIYALAWEQISTQPSSLLSGALRAWEAFFRGASGSWVSHLLVPPQWLPLRESFQDHGLAAVDLVRDAWLFPDVVGYYALRFLPNALLVVGLVVAWRSRRSASGSLALACWAGILLSVPFAPPWDADNMRAYATTIPFLLTVPLMGAAVLLPAERHPAVDPPPAWRWEPVALAVLLAGALASGPFLRGAGAPLTPANGTGSGCPCQAGEARTVWVNPRNAVHLVAPPLEGGARRAGNFVNVRDLRMPSMLRPYPETLQSGSGIAGLPAGTTLAVAFDREQGRVIYVQSDSAVFPDVVTMTQVCGHTRVRGAVERLEAEVWGCQPRAKALGHPPGVSGVRARCEAGACAA